MQAVRDLGYTVRPATMNDIEQAVVLFNVCTQETQGANGTDVDHVRTEWGTPNFDLETDTRLVFAPDQMLVGYIELWDTQEPHVKLHCWGRVHPDHRGQGLGTALLEWAETRAQESLDRAPKGARVTLTQYASDKEIHGRRLLEDHGYSVIRHFYRMRVDFPETIPEPEWAEGITVRSFDPDKDLEAMVHAVRDAFRDHWGHVDTPFDEELASWKQWIEDSKNVDPNLWFLAMDGKEIVGMSLCKETYTPSPEIGWINVLGVRRPWRRRGIALALLHHTYHALRAKGKTGAGLGVDATSLTGANRVYERAGMRPEIRDDAFEKELRSGVDLTLRSLDSTEAGSREVNE